MRALRVKDPTLLKYHDAVQNFEPYCRRRRMTNTDIEAADKHMAEFFADLYEDGKPYNSASYALFGFLVLRTDDSRPEKMLFPRARGALKGWSPRSPQSSRTGADPLIWHLVGLTISEVCPPAAAAFLLQLDTFARPTEILHLCRRDVIKPASRHCKFWGVIFGNSEVGDATKTGTQDDTVLLDSDDRRYAAKVLQAVFSRVHSQDDWLFPSLTLAKYEQLFRDAKTKLKLGQFGLTPHAVRHSGPSADFLAKTRGASEIQARGRWKTMQSVLRYQKPGQMQAKMNRIPKEIWIRASQALPRLLQRLEQFYGKPT